MESRETIISYKSNVLMIYKDLEHFGYKKLDVFKFGQIFFSEI